MNTFLYYLSYQKEDDSFSGWVENELDRDIVFEICDSREMAYLIANSYMDHIDDIVGLKVYLVQEGVLDENDKLYLAGIYNAAN